MNGINPSSLFDGAKRLERPEAGLVVVRTRRMHSEIKGEFDGI